MTRIWKAVEITTWVVCSLYAVGLSCAEPMGAMHFQGRSGVLRTEPVPVSALRAPATIAKGEVK